MQPLCGRHSSVSSPFCVIRGPLLCASPCLGVSVVISRATGVRLTCEARALLPACAERDFELARRVAGDARAGGVVDRLCQPVDARVARIEVPEPAEERGLGAPETLD